MRGRYALPTLVLALALANSAPAAQVQTRPAKALDIYPALSLFDFRSSLFVTDALRERQPTTTLAAAHHPR
jgi:hypothetical protein